MFQGKKARRAVRRVNLRRRRGERKGEEEEEEWEAQEEELCTSPLPTPHCKYTSKTHPKVWQDAALPASASFMNVTHPERGK